MKYFHISLHFSSVHFIISLTFILVVISDEIIFLVNYEIKANMKYFESISY